MSPLESAHISDDAASNPSPYLGVCNPPRKAKRNRSDDIPQSLLSPPSSTVTSPTFPTLDKSSSVGTPALTVGSDSNASKKRAGRKPGTLSRAAREAQRKMNHSLIEKARRTKINDALATLRSLIPRDPVADEEEVSSRGSGGNEREFKLEILERAVTYLQELTSKVKELEKPLGGAADRTCRHCMIRKRKRTEGDDGYEADNDNDGNPTQLPPISAWLHLHNHLDPSSLPLTPNESPATPSLTGTPMLASSLSLKRIDLSSPLTFLPPALNLPSPRLDSSVTGQRSVPPSPEERSAANLLLQIASSTSSSSSRDGPKESTVKPHTPSSILGLI